VLYFSSVTVLFEYILRPNGVENDASARPPNLTSACYHLDLWPRPQNR